MLPKNNIMRLFFSLLIFFSCISQFSFSQTPVILRVKSEEQDDTLGVDIVHDLMQITYDAIKDGRIQLWDSHKKEVSISFKSLIEIEKNSSINFVDQQMMYVYEVWYFEKKKLFSQTQGFMFSSRLPNGESVLFGYVEYEPLKNIIATASPRINANGDCYLNLNNYLSKKKYNYQILQFGDKVIDNITDSKLLKENFIGLNEFNFDPLAKDTVESKYIETLISKSDKMLGSKANSSLDFILSLTNYFHQNLEVLYNLSGNDADNKLGNGDWKITSITFVEIWHKKNDVVNSTPLWMLVDIDNKVIDTLWMDNLVNWDFNVQGVQWLDFLRSKNYLYLITKINSDLIPLEKAIKYQKGLYNHKWNNLINFVENY